MCIFLLAAGSEAVVPLVRNSTIGMCQVLPLLRIAPDHRSHILLSPNVPGISKNPAIQESESATVFSARGISVKDEYSKH